MPVAGGTIVSEYVSHDGSTAKHRPEGLEVRNGPPVQLDEAVACETVPALGTAACDDGGGNERYQADEQADEQKTYAHAGLQFTRGTGRTSTVIPS